MTPPSRNAELSGPSEIIKLGTAFCEAKAVLTAVELGLFSLLSEGAATAAEIRERLGLHPRGAKNFLNLLVALGLLSKHQGRYHNTQAADRYLVRGQPAYVGGFLESANYNLYPAWGRLTEALRTGRPQADGDFMEMIKHPDQLARFLDMMDALTSLLAPELAQSFPWPERGCVADIGGARGNLVARLVEAHPKLSGIVFDLPEMAPFFRDHMEALGVNGRVRFQPGDFFHDPMPEADVLILGHVLHDWSADQKRMLIRKAYAALPPGGILLVYDRMTDEDNLDLDNLVVSLDMLLVTQGGSAYTISECRMYMEEAGFALTWAQPLGDKDTLVVGCKAPAADGNGR